MSKSIITCNSSPPREPRPLNSRLRLRCDCLYVPCVALLLSFPYLPDTSRPQTWLHKGAHGGKQPWTKKQLTKTYRCISDLIDFRLINYITSAAIFFNPVFSIRERLLACNSLSLCLHFLQTILRSYLTRNNSRYHIIKQQSWVCRVSRNTLRSTAPMPWCQWSSRSSPEVVWSAAAGRDPLKLRSGCWLTPRTACTGSTAASTPTGWAEASGTTCSGTSQPSPKPVSTATSSC